MPASSRSALRGLKGLERLPSRITPTTLWGFSSLNYLYCFLKLQFNDSGRKVTEAWITFTSFCCFGSVVFQEVPFRYESYGEAVFACICCFHTVLHVSLLRGSQESNDKKHWLTESDMLLHKFRFECAQIQNYMNYWAITIYLEAKNRKHKTYSKFCNHFSSS